MDRTDLQILEILQANARATIKQIGKDVNLSPPSVTERIRRLEESGVITGYHAQIDPLKLSKNLNAFIGIDVIPRRYASFTAFCSTSPLILEHYRVIGEYNALLLASLHDSSELEQLLDHLKRYGATSSSVVLSTIFKNKPMKY